MNATAQAAAPQAQTAQKPQKTSITVTMDDGREVEFVGKKRQLKEALFSTDGEWMSTRIDFINGQSRTFTAPDASTLLKADGQDRFALHQFAAHGSLQKFGDATAGYKEDELDDAILAVEELMGRVAAGEWSAEREGGVGGMAGTSVLILALVEATGKTYEQLKEWLKGKTKEQKDAMRASDKLRPIVQRIEAERAAKSAHVNTDELFAEIDAAA